MSTNKNATPKPDESKDAIDPLFDSEIPVVETPAPEAEQPVAPAPQVVVQERTVVLSQDQLDAERLVKEHKIALERATKLKDELEAPGIDISNLPIVDDEFRAQEMQWLKDGTIPKGWHLVMGDPSTEKHKEHISKNHVPIMLDGRQETIHGQECFMVPDVVRKAGQLSAASESKAQLGEVAEEAKKTLTEDVIKKMPAVVRDRYLAQQAEAAAG